MGATLLFPLGRTACCFGMSGSGRQKAITALSGFTFITLLPGGAIRSGLLPFDWRFHALLLVSGLCIATTLFAGYSMRELGVSAPRGLGRWLACGAFTATLAALIAVEARLCAVSHDPPPWLAFAPFYVLVSCPCQEIVCRAIPRLIADRLAMSGPGYVVYSATIFALMHSAYGDSLLLLNTFVAGLVWGVAYLRLRNIWPVAVSHATIGLLAFWLGVA